jgi:DNA-binding MarR family transcriptional regulator
MDYQVTQLVCFKSDRFLRKVERFYNNKLKTHAITSTQLFVLVALLEKDGIKFKEKELADLVNMEGSTLSGILDRMAQKELIERHTNPEDARSVLVYLTPKAKIIGPDILKTAEEIDHDVKSRLSEGEFSIFLEILDKITME